MRNVWELFKGDLKRLRGNVVTVICVLGIIALPSIFSWYNMIASWNVFENTGNLSVAVANTDEGYKSDLVPIKVSVGDQVVSALRANDQINWVVTTEEDAIDGARSGKYYAAVVIPESFSRDMMTFYSDDVQHAQIIYYSNEKKNAIAPKVTDQGADQVSSQVNQVFMETLSDAALAIAQDLLNYADTNDVDGAIGDLGDHVEVLSGQMTRASSVLRAYSSILGSSRDLVSSSADLLSQAKESASEVSSQVERVKGSGENIISAMDSATAALSQAVETSSSTFGSVQTAVDTAFDSADATTANTASSLHLTATNLRSQAGNYSNIADQLAAMKGSLPDDSQLAVEAMILQMRSTAALMNALADSIDQSADDMVAGVGDKQEQREQIKKQIDEAKQAVDDAKAQYDENLKPQLDSLSATIADLSSQVSGSAALLGNASDDLTGAAGSVSSGLDGAKAKLDSAADNLDRSAAKLAELSDAIAGALATGDKTALHNVLSGDTSSLANAISAPVVLDRHALYPVENFGSAMAPLYTSLALWIGALLIMVTFSLNPSERILRELDNPKPPQIFLGRFGIVALMSIAQSTVLCLGNMFFLRVQVDNPWLYLLCFIVSGLVFAFIIYTLVASFANLGKAVAVILLILQVAGGGGSYPLAILLDFFQDLSVWLPVTHVVNAMRAAMFGMYNNDFWIEIGTLLLFTVPFILLGFVLRNPMIKLVDWFVEKVEESKVI